MGEGKLTTWDFVAIALYFASCIAVGIYSLIQAKRGTVSGYFLAGRFMIWLPVGASLFASNIGSEHFIGLAGSGAAAGVAVGAFELNACILLQLLGWVFLPVYIASGVCTLPEYMKKRFGGHRIQIYLAGLSLMLYIFTKISVNLYSGALFIQQALQWNIYGSVFLLLAVTAITTVTGGLTAVIYTDTLQAFVMVIGSVSLTVISFIKIGGYKALYHKYLEAIPNSTLHSNSTCGYPREDSWIMLRDPVNSDMPWPAFLLGQTPASIWYWCADQMMVQRALAAKSLSHAQGGTLFAGYLKLLPIFIMVLPGMISRVLFTDEVACADPESCTKVCGNPVGCSNIAYPKLVLELMPTGLKGIMLSVMLAALMSDLTSIFNSASTLFTMDIYRLFRKKAKTKELMVVGRVFVCLMVVIGILWIPIIESMQGAQLFIYIQAISAYLAPPIASVYLIAILWKRANETGAFTGLMVGLIVGVIRMVLDFVYSEPRCGEEDTRPIFLHLHYMYFALILFSLTAMLMILISLCTKPPTEKQVTRTTYFTRYDKSYSEECAVSPSDSKDIEHLTVTTTSVAENQNNSAKRSSLQQTDEVLLNALVLAEEHDDVKIVNKDMDYNVKYKDNSVNLTLKGNKTAEGKETKTVLRKKSPILRSFLKYVCGLEEAEISIKQTAEMEVRMQKISSLKQNRSAKISLLVALLVLFLLNIFLYLFFCFGSNMFGLIE